VKRLLILASMMAVAVEAQEDTTAEALPAVRPISGDLHVWRHAQDKLEPIKESMGVAPADRLGTRKDKYATLVTDDGTLISLSSVEVGHERGLALERTKGQLLIKIYRGKVVLDSVQTTVRVETPNGAVEGARSCFVVKVDGEKTDVRVVEGPVTFTHPLGTIKIGDGQESSAGRTTRPSDPKPAEPEKAASDLLPHDGVLNLIKNPGFEDGLKNWSVETFEGRERVSLETALSHGGSRSVRLEISNRVYGTGRPEGWLGFKQNLGLTPGKHYLFRAYVRLDAREGVVKPFFSISGSGGPKWTVDPAEKGWRRVGGIYVPAPNDKSGPRVSIEATVESDRYDAVLWADDFLLLEVK
jgi:hypothetical protein